MSYCYCTPSRSLYRHDVMSSARIAPGTAYAVAPQTDRGYLPYWQSQEAVMGTKRDWVQRSRREASIRGWVTRRANAARKAQAEAAETETVVYVPFVIDAPTAAPETEPVRDLITA